MDVTPQEEFIIKLLRDLKPFETMKIEADKDGRLGSCYIIRSQRMSVSNLGMVALKLKNNLE